MSFSTPIDEVAFAALRRGCRRTQERVYHSYASAAWTLAVRLCGCESNSWDVVQNSFIKAFSRIDQLDDPARFGPWLRQIIARQVTDGFRRQSLQLAEDYDAPAAGSDPGGAMDLERALQRLGDLDRTVLWLHDAEGFKHTEIAALLEQTVPWSKTRLSRARARVREMLGDAQSQEGRSVAHG